MRSSGRSSPAACASARLRQRVQYPATTTTKAGHRKFKYQKSAQSACCCLLSRFEIRPFVRSWRAVCGTYLRTWVLLCLRTRRLEDIIFLIPNCTAQCWGVWSSLAVVVEKARRVIKT